MKDEFGSTNSQLICMYCMNASNDVADLFSIFRSSSCTTRLLWGMVLIETALDFELIRRFGETKRIWGTILVKSYFG